MAKDILNKEFTSIDEETKKPITTCRNEWESMGCSIDMTQVSDDEMKKVAKLLYLQGDDVMIDFAENFLMTKTKAKYIEDYSDEEFKAYEKRKNKLYLQKV